MSCLKSGNMITFYANETFFKPIIYMKCYLTYNSMGKNNKI